MNYILGTDFHLFRNVYVRDPRHNPEHYIVLVCLRRAPLREHAEYLRRCTRIPLQSLVTPTIEDRIFAALRRSILKPRARKARKNA